MKTIISSSSYLLPSQDIWCNLQEISKVEFNDYGSLFVNNTKKKYNYKISVIFLQDILNYYSIDNKENFQIEKIKIDTIIKKIINSITNKDTKYIICISYHFYTNIIDKSKKKILVKQIYEYFINKLYSISKNNNNLFIIEIDDVFSDHGFLNCFEKRNYYSFKCHLSEKGLKLLSESIEKLIIKSEKPSKKILLLDCDNTIWGGVVGEDGLKNLLIGSDGIGSAYTDFQNAALKLKKHGILIGLISKNEEKDVLDVLNNHQSMVLKKKDITIMKVNWNEKFKNIKEISDELSLGLNSFVFWDDNPVEREKVKINLKDVEVIEPDLDVANWPKQLLEYQGFSKFEITKEDKEKSNQYKIRGEFLKKKSSSKNELDYLKNIKIRPKIYKINDSNLLRAEQLCMKTNQFNFSTKRYKINDIKKFPSKDMTFLVSLKDVYGDHGLVSFVNLKEKSEYLLIDTFIMSCRIIGRYLENWILNEIRKISLKKKKKFLVAEFIKTERNIVAKKFLEKNFQKLNKDIPKDLRKNKGEFYKFNSIKKVNHIEIYE